mmetsp:Transcript_17055/g.25031  ORF Transcript_17055/g.25031 Transcript_17055/m.25031 type:complete len:316 (+) Transcript_17055:64-1011(+)
MHAKDQPRVGDDVNNEQTCRKRVRLNYNAQSSSCVLGSILMHHACTERRSLIFFSWLLKECPEAAKEKDTLGKTPLHCACENSASFEVVSLLLKAYPEASKIKDNNGMTPLHYECENGSSIDIVSLLFESFPDAVMEKDVKGRTALHCLCSKRTSVEKKQHAMAEHIPETSHETGHLQFASSNCPPINVVALLLEWYPSAVTEEEEDGNTPLDYWNEHHSPDHDERIATILYGIDNLHDDDLDPSIALHIIEEFIQFDWWAGVALAFDLCSSTVEMLDDIPTAAVPTLLSVLVRRCKKLTIWNFIIERQDILKID